MPKLTLVMERTPLPVYELDRPIVRLGRVVRAVFSPTLD